MSICDIHEISIHRRNHGVTDLTLDQNFFKEIITVSAVHACDTSTMVCDAFVGHFKVT